MANPHQSFSYAASPPAPSTTSNPAFHNPVMAAARYAPMKQQQSMAVNPSLNSSSTAMPYNPTQLQLNSGSNPQLQIAHAKAMVQQQQQQHQSHFADQQQQFGYDARMMPPPPPPHQRPPSTRPGTAQHQQRPTPPFQQPPQAYPQAYQSMNMTPGQLTQLQHLHAHAQAGGQQPVGQPPQPQLQDPRLVLSPATRKRKLGTSALVVPPAPVPPTTINPNVQRMNMSQSASSSQLNPAITRITTIPLAGSGVHIPPLSSFDMINMKEWMGRDKDYEKAWSEMRGRNSKEIQAIVTKKAWWEEDSRKLPTERMNLVWPHQKRNERAKKLKMSGIRWEGVRLPGKLNKDLADRREDLVPIRLELDVDHHKLRETFVWNINDPIITPELFAQSLVDDFKLASHYVNTIARAIHEQLQEHEAHDDLMVGESKGVMDEGDGKWWSAWRQRIRTEEGFIRVEYENDAEDEAEDEGKKRGKKKRRMIGVVADEVMGEVPMDVEELKPQTASDGEESRILIKLDILVGTMKLDDQFEWDVACSTNSPEAFATLYSAELGLPGEFTTAIAHQIREQVHAYRKPYQGPSNDDDETRSFLPTLTRTSVARSPESASAHMPLLNYMSDGEIERTERERDKELKRKRRSARGRQVGGTRTIPDRTHRTPGIGFPEQEGAVGDTAVPMSRRAAAAAASLTIANMVASENGGSPIQMSMPDPVRPIVHVKEKEKETRTKKLFRAPPMNMKALRPRAKVVAPTTSTSLDPARYRRGVGAPKEGEAEELAPVVPAKLTAKQLRDLEKEAKEKEYAEGQHENMIGGVWHCSNCGCPETIAVGRRKGPLGDKSQCGPCGKFYHRHRRPRPVEYHAEESYHINLRNEADRARAVNRRRGGAAALRAMNQEATSAPESSTSVINLRAEDGDEDEEVANNNTTTTITINNHNNVVDSVDPPLGAASPADTMSSDEPLALGSKRVNGAGAVNANVNVTNTEPANLSPTGPLASSSALTSSPGSQVQTSPQLAARPASGVRSGRNQAPRPEWLKAALDAMLERYPEDKFDVVLRKTTEASAPAEWRVKCLDCPGKLYTPGPAETLANFEVHLRNRNHRARVNARVQGITPPP